MTRRAAIACAAGAGLVRAEAPPLAELVNVWELEQAARRVLAVDRFAQVAGGDRRAFDRMTFRPRLMVDVTKLDLTTELFGDRHLAPILVGPVADLGRYHAEGEVAMARGAKAAKAGVVLAARATMPVEKAVAAGGPAWVQVDPGPEAAARANAAVKAGCKAVCLTLGAGGERWDWAAVGKFRAAVSAPVLVKGIMSAEDARAAIAQGAAGVVVSNYGAAARIDAASAIDVLASVVAAAGPAPVLIDGSFRRGTDILKALAFGARAVLVARPAVWGLAAYGADGVKHALELLQSELARAMVMCGVVNPAAARPDHVRVHRR